MTFHVPEKRRIKTGPMRSTSKDGNNGQFRVNSSKFNRSLMVQASDGIGWEHVSVSTYDRCPTWTEMCYIKNLFWDAEDMVIQYHPPESQYVNDHPYVLHMWRPVDIDIPVPPLITV